MRRTSVPRRIRTQFQQARALAPPPVRGPWPSARLPLKLANPTPAPGPPAGYFPGAYFGGDYFAPDYFPPEPTAEEPPE